MQVEVVTTPRRFKLYGYSSPVEGMQFPQVGLPLMDRLWKLVGSKGIDTTGVNYWVYPNVQSMFVGTEVPASTPPGNLTELECLEFELPRYLQHVHRGPYDLLAEKWAALMASLPERGETAAGYALEIYGPHTPNPADAETTILIGVKRAASC